MFRISHYPGYYNRDEYYRNCKFPLFFNSHDSHFIGYYVFCPKVVFKSDETATKKISDFFVGFDDLLVMNLKNHIVEAINQSSSILKKAKGKQATSPIFEKYVSFLLDDSFNEQQNSIKLQKLDNQQPQITFDSVDFGYNTNTVSESCSFNFARGLVQKKRI